MLLIVGLKSYLLLRLQFFDAACVKLSFLLLICAFYAALILSLLQQAPLLLVVSVDGRFLLPDFLLLSLASASEFLGLFWLFCIGLKHHVLVSQTLLRFLLYLGTFKVLAYTAFLSFVG